MHGSHGPLLGAPGAAAGSVALKQGHQHAPTRPQIPTDTPRRRAAAARRGTRRVYRRFGRLRTALSPVARDAGARAATAPRRPAPVTRPPPAVATTRGLTRTTAAQLGTVSHGAAAALRPHPTPRRLPALGLFATLYTYTSVHVSSANEKGA